MSERLDRTLALRAEPLTRKAFEPFGDEQDLKQPLWVSL